MFADIENGLDQFQHLHAIGREVDFLVTRERRPWLLAECKLSERAPAPSLQRFARILRPEIAVQIVGDGAVHEVFDWDRGRGQRGHVVAADRFLGLLP